MTNTFAVWLFVAVLAAFTIDYAVWDSTGALFAARRFSDLLTTIAFWR